MTATPFQYVKREGDSTLHFAYKERGDRPWPGPIALCSMFVDRVVASIDPDGKQQLCKQCEVARGIIIAKEAEAHVETLLAEALDPTCLCNHARSFHVLGPACRNSGCPCQQFLDKDDDTAA